HERGGDVAPLEVFIAIKAVWPGQIGPMAIELWGERVIEPAARSPQEADADFPSGLGARIKHLPADAQIIEEMLGKIRRGAFSHSDDTQLRTANDTDIQRRDFPLERDGCDETGAAGPEHEEVLNHLGGRCVEVSTRELERSRALP